MMITSDVCAGDEHTNIFSLLGMCEWVVLLLLFLLDVKMLIKIQKKKKTKKKKV